MDGLSKQNRRAKTAAELHEQLASTTEHRLHDLSRSGVPRSAFRRQNPHVKRRRVNQTDVALGGHRNKDSIHIASEQIVAAIGQYNINTAALGDIGKHV